MNIGAQLAFPGAILGSLVVALFGFSVTSNVKAEALPTQPPVSAPASAAPAQMEQSAQAAGPEQVQAEEDIGMTTEELFEASIAYTPAEGVEVNGSGPVECGVSDRFPPSILQWCEYITTYSENHDLPPDLIAAVMLQESGGQPLAYSHSGAVGLMQVMPRDGIAEKFICKNGPCFTSRPTIAELQDPEYNVAYGVKMLSGLVTRFGNFRDGLKSYGPMDVGYSYADKVLAIYQRYGK
jgi:soluble lytic murein transglycosylase-like protein